VTLSSFNYDWLRFIRKHAPEYERQALVGACDDQPLNLDDALFTGTEFDVLNINALLVHPSDVRRLKGSGKRINLFTVNDPGDYQRFVDAGVDGIFTDFPQYFI
jgi:glycerophosphoryl diester phosphodiesterase